MRILIDINHPAHVHLFKNLAIILQGKGHEVLFTTRDKDGTLFLLAYYNLDYISFGKNYKGLFGKLWGWVKYDFLLLKTVLKYKPEFLISHNSFYAAQISWLTGRIHIAMEDTGNKEQTILSNPFNAVIITSTSFPLKYGYKQIFYGGYHELAYLHPKNFTPDINILQKLNIKKDEKYVILRFVSWHASHDKGHQGISFDNKIRVVKEFEKYSKVFISSESPLPSELKKYKINIEHHEMHHALAYSSLLFGESATMASESAMVGSPAIYLDNTGRYYTDELESEYGLVFNYSESPEDQEAAINKGIEILKSQTYNDEWQQRRQKMLADKIDLTAFLVWFVENYPQSFKIMKENPDYQNRFK